MAKLAVLTFELLWSLTLVDRQAGPLAMVALGLAHTVRQCLRGADDGLPPANVAAASPTPRRGTATMIGSKKHGTV